MSIKYRFTYVSHEFICWQGVNVRIAKLWDYFDSRSVQLISGIITGTAYFIFIFLDPI
jgi:hypothetical protein